VSNLHVGDRVKIVDSAGYEGRFKLGDIAKVIEVSYQPDNLARIEFEGGARYEVFSWRLTPVPEVKAEEPEEILVKASDVWSALEEFQGPYGIGSKLLNALADLGVVSPKPKISIFRVELEGTKSGDELLLLLEDVGYSVSSVIKIEDAK